VALLIQRLCDDSIAGMQQYNKMHGGRTEQTALFPDKMIMTLK